MKGSPALPERGALTRPAQQPIVLYLGLSAVTYVRVKWTTYLTNWRTEGPYEVRKRETEEVEQVDRWETKLRRRQHHKQNNNNNNQNILSLQKAKPLNENKTTTSKESRERCTTSTGRINESDGERTNEPKSKNQKKTTVENPQPLHITDTVPYVRTSYIHSTRLIHTVLTVTTYYIYHIYQMWITTSWERKVERERERERERIYIERFFHSQRTKTKTKQK